MSVSIGGQAFQGPFPHTSHLREQAGVFAVLCEADGKLYPMDMDEAGDVKAAVEEHPRASCWEERCAGNLMTAVYYTPLLTSQGRREIVETLREGYEWPCGDASA